MKTTPQLSPSIHGQMSPSACKVNPLLALEWSDVQLVAFNSTTTLTVLTDQGSRSFLFASTDEREAFLDEWIRHIARRNAERNGGTTLAASPPASLNLLKSLPLSILTGLAAIGDVSGLVSSQLA